jgi:hypothetical protein
MEISWLTELRKHCQCREVIPIFSLPKQGREFTLYLHLVVGSCSPELRPSGAVRLSGLGEW